MKGFPSQFPPLAALTLPATVPTLEKVGHLLCDSEGNTEVVWEEIHANSAKRPTKGPKYNGG